MCTERVPSRTTDREYTRVCIINLQEQLPVGIIINVQEELQL